jgi:hypothetical protein
MTGDFNDIVSGWVMGYFLKPQLFYTLGNFYNESLIK